MIFDFILNGLGEILGFEIILVFVFLLVALLFLASKGAGITGMLGASFLTFYLFSTQKISGYYLFATDLFVAVVIALGLFVGFMVYMLWFS